MQVHEIVGPYIICIGLACNLHSSIQALLLFSVSFQVKIWFCFFFFFWDDLVQLFPRLILFSPGVLTTNTQAEECILGIGLMNHKSPRLKLVSTSKCSELSELSCSSVQRASLKDTPVSQSGNVLLLLQKYLGLNCGSLCFQQVSEPLLSFKCQWYHMGVKVTVCGPHVLIVRIK